MTKVYIYDYSNTNYFPDIFSEDLNDIVIGGNKHYMSYTEAEWFTDVTNLISDVCEVDEDYLNDILKDYCINKNQYREIVKILDHCDYINDYNTIAKVLDVVYPESSYTVTMIKGYCQGDWNYILYDEKKYSPEIIKSMEAYYFGMISDVKIQDDDNEYQTDIPHYDLWKIENDHAALCNYLDVPEDSEIFKEDGKVTTITFKKIG